MLWGKQNWILSRNVTLNIRKILPLESEKGMRLMSKIWMILIKCSEVHQKWKKLQLIRKTLSLTN